MHLEQIGSTQPRGISSSGGGKPKKMMSAQQSQALLHQRQDMLAQNIGDNIQSTSNLMMANGNKDLNSLMKIL